MSLIRVSAVAVNFTLLHVWGVFKDIKAVSVHINQLFKWWCGRNITIFRKLRCVIFPILYFLIFIHFWYSLPVVFGSYLKTKLAQRPISFWLHYLDYWQVQLSILYLVLIKNKLCHLKLELHMIFFFNISYFMPKVVELKIKWSPI